MFNWFHQELEHLKERFKKMTATVSDLDTKLAKLDSSVDAILQKLASAGNPPPPPPAVDVTAEANAVDAIQAKLDAALNPPANNSGDGSGGTVSVQTGA